MSERLRFTTLRTSILAALGLSIAACGASTNDTDESELPVEGDGGAHDARDAETIDADGERNPVSVCDGVEPILGFGGTPTGFYLCPDGTRYRAEAIVMETPVQRPGTCKGTEKRRYCSTDADCTKYPYGRCLSGKEANFAPDGPAYVDSCDCHYECGSDDDCPGGACIPNGVWSGSSSGGFCANADCRTGADCASGECGLYEFTDGCFERHLALGCRTADDACRVDSDCRPYDHCGYLGAEAGWGCHGELCMPGRPLFIEGRARRASSQSRDDWTGDELIPDVSTLAPELRERLAQHWLDIAAMEHASVGSFARFSLQLLALGASPDLLAETQRAALDEVEHARMAYGVASAYAGRKLGPGPLDPTGIQLVTNRAEALRALIFEACVNETLGVAEALAMADTVRDALLAEVHRRIARDEQRHAELAWRTLAWLLDGATREEVEEAERAFAEAIQAAKLAPNVTQEPAPEHGLLDSKSLGALRRQALAQVIEPCASQLLGRLKLAA